MSLIKRMVHAASQGLARATARPAVEANSSTNLGSVVLPSSIDRWMGTAAKDYTPDRIEQVLRGAMSGDLRAQWELFDLMEATWPRLQKDLGDLKEAVISLDWGVQAWTDGENEPSPGALDRKQFCEAAIWKMRARPECNENGFEGTIRDVLDAWGKGISVLEIDYAAAPVRVGGRVSSPASAVPGGILPRATRWVHPRYYGYQQIGDELQLNISEVQSSRSRSSQTATSSQFGSSQVTTNIAPLPEVRWAPFPDNKFLICVAKQKSGHPIGGSLLRALAWWWAASNFSSSWLLNFAQIFGLPIRWATYDPSRPGLLKQICAMLEQMGSAAWAAFPQGTQLELKEPMKSGTDNPQSNLLDRADRQCDLLILGQTLTSDVGASGSRALGQVHEGVRADRIMAVARFAASVLNEQFLGAICRLNYGDEEQCPYFLPAAHEVKDAMILAQRDQLLSQMGVDFPRTWFYERHEIPLPDPNEEVISSSSQTASSQTANGGMGQDTNPESNQGRRGDLPSRQKPYQVKAKDAGPVPADTMRQIVADAAGARVKWLGPVSEEIDRIARMAQDKSLSREEMAKFLEVAARRLPDLFADLDSSAFVSRIEDAVGTAAFAGASDAITKQNK